MHENEDENNENEELLPPKGNFFSDNKKVILKGLGILSIILILFSLVSLILYLRKDLDDYAQEFCNCASASDSEFYNYTKDGFGYRSDLTSCFADQFKSYGEGYSSIEKEKILQEFQEKVMQKCPEKLSRIFEYK